MITFACPTCQKQFSVKDELGKCPGCGQMVVIPSQVADATQGGNTPDSNLTDFLAPPQADDEMGRLGKYRVLKILGHGGMGVVFKAEDPKLKRSVAVKAMLPTLAASDSAGKRFLREAQAMAAVEHDHIVRIHQVDEEHGVPFLVMEFLKGETLGERLKRDRKLPLPEVLRIGREIAEGLEAAHATGLIHRDIKPSNIWLEVLRGRVKILDFGLARVVSQDARLTQEGAIIGTPAYMPPEQARGETVDARSDLFSLGGVLYRMLTGQQPFQGKDIISTLLAVVSDQPLAPAEVPQELSDLVMKLLEKDPDRRPSSAGEVVEVLQALERKMARQSDTVPIKPEPSAVAEAKPRRRRMLLLFAVGLVALLPLGWWLASVVVRVETANGTLIVEINDEETEARIKNGKLILTGPDDKVRYTLAPSERHKKIEAGAYKIRVEGADGLVLDTPEFTMKKDGKVTVRVTVAPKAVVKIIDPDRKAAEYVLSLGGMVKVNGQGREIKVAADLPRGTFRLTEVVLNRTKVSDVGLANFEGCKTLTALDLEGTQASDPGLTFFKDCKNLAWLNLSHTQVSDKGLVNFKDCKGLKALRLGNTQVIDAGLANFKDCKSLTFLLLDNTQVSDKGLAHFQECKSVRTINLGDTKVSDAGMANFKDCKGLTQLDLNNTKVSDTGMANFKDRKGLRRLNLSGTQVSDAGLAYFKDCKNLMVLELSGTKVSDSGLAHFKDCKNLTGLHLGNTNVSDAGLAHFKDCKGLTHLWLHETKVSDAGLVHLKDCKNLTRLSLQKTKVTRAKVEELKKALPRCKIDWDEK